MSRPWKEGAPDRFDAGLPWSYRVYTTGNRNNSTMYTRFRRTGKANGEVEVEIWESYCPRRPGKLGRQRSVLRARFKAIKNGEKRQYVSGYKPTGYAETFFFSGEPECRIWFTDSGVDDRPIKEIRFLKGRKLRHYRDATRGEFNTREVVLDHTNDLGQDGSPRVVRWQGKYSMRVAVNDWQVERGSYDVSRNEQGLPLALNGDYTTKRYDRNGNVIMIQKFVGGREHGERKIFNKQGRQVDSEYFHHGTRIPRWVYEKPETIEVAEILEEDNSEVRRAMLELQGFDVFLARAEKAGMVRVIDQDPDDKVGTLLQVELEPTQTDQLRRFRRFAGAEDTSLDATIFMLLKVKDGTLPKSYVLRVPRNMKTARQANAWTWGLEADEYKPSIER